MRKFFATLLTILLVFGSVGTGIASTPAESQYLFDQINTLLGAGKMSNDEVYGIYIDLTDVPQGSIASTVYQTNLQLTTLYTASVYPQPIEGANGAKDKICRWFWHIRNNQTDNIMAQWGGASQQSIMQFVYGPQKIEILNSYVTGIPECLANDRIVYDYGAGDGFGSTNPTTVTDTTNNTNPNAWADAYLETIFTVNSTSVTSTSNTEVNTNEATTTAMDVAPYIKNDRTYVPVAYLAYSLGVPNNGVTWNGTTQQVGIANENTNITLTIGSPIMLVNQNPVRMDVSPEITNSRTFLPAGWVAEALGADVSWNPETNQIVIKTPIEAPGS